MEREIINIRDITGSDYPYDIEGYEMVEDDECGFDAEHGFIDHKCVIYRKSDKKYFSFKYTQFGYNGTDLLKQKMKEVFPKEKTITITVYE